MKEIIRLLNEKNETISTMESCTGGYIANEITNIPGSSNVFSFGAVTYSNEYKIKMGVLKEIIEQFTVYSQETAEAMAKAICNYTNSTYGIGITGKLNAQDPKNKEGSINKIYIAIYNKKEKTITNAQLDAEETRIKSKEKIYSTIVKLLNNIIK